jgi:uncharacterized membrane protein YoaK (UPF0700 family)
MSCIRLREVLESKVSLACGVAFVTGWLDVLCMLRFATFSTMMTGNLILLLRALPNASSVEPIVWYSVNIHSYYGGSVMYRGLDHLLHHRSSATLMAPLIVTLMISADVASAVLGDATWHVSRTETARDYTSAWLRMRQLHVGSCLLDDHPSGQP